jgi:hypothetical protein
MCDRNSAAAPMDHASTIATCARGTLFQRQRNKPAAPVRAKAGMDTADTHLTTSIEDPNPRPPAISLLLGLAGVLPIPSCALLSLVLDPTTSDPIVRLTIVWSGAGSAFANKAVQPWRSSAPG